MTNGQGTIYVSASPSPNTSAVVRLSEEEYRSEFEAMADDDLRLTVFGLAEFVRMWAEAHGGSPPAPSEMTPDSDFGSHLAELVDGLGPEEVIPWPWNPFTGEPIAIGASRATLSTRPTARISLSAPTTPAAPWCRREPDSPNTRHPTSAST